MGGPRRRCNADRSGAAERGPAARHLLDHGADLAFEEANALNDKLRRPLEATKDYLEGINAFFEKRPARYIGE